MQKLLRRLSYLFRRDRLEGELDEELQFHVEMKQRELEAGGMDADAAAKAARRGVGNVPLTRDQVRDVWIWPWLQDFSRDLRFSVRSLTRNAGFTATVVLTLALGLGVNLTVFAVSYGLLWQPLPYADASQIVTLRIERTDQFTSRIGDRSVERWLRELQTPEAVAAYRLVNVTVRGIGDPQVMPIVFVTEGFFDVLGTPAELPQSTRGGRVCLPRGGVPRRCASTRRGGRAAHGALVPHTGFEVRHCSSRRTTV